MTGPLRITSVLKAYTESSRISRKSRSGPGQIEDRVQISKEGRQKSKEFLAGLNGGTCSTKETPATVGADNLEILNLSAGAGMDQIHNAYLSAIKQYHPDKFNDLGPEFQKLAEEKSKQIILAYEKLT
ncbi:MAG: J domain-containing protein [Syntrophobacteraceae bacterium]